MRSLRFQPEVCLATAGIPSCSTHHVVEVMPTVVPRDGDVVAQTAVLGEQDSRTLAIDHAPKLAIGPRCSKQGPGDRSPQGWKKNGDLDKLPFAEHVQ
jgi:hypothetical protein